MSLIVFWFVGEDMWIDVEGFEMVSIDDTTDGFICIGSAVTFGGCLSKIVLEFCV